MIRKLFFISLILITINAEEMPISAKAGQCFTKAFFPPKELKTVRTTFTKKVVLRKSTIKYDVIPAKYKWIDKRVKISDGTEKIIAIPPLYKTVYQKILIESAKKIWKKGLGLNSPKAFNSCVESASNGGMDILNAKVGTCFYEHYIGEKYITTTEKILTSEASERVITTPAKYKTYTKKIMIDSTSEKLVPVVAKYKKVKEKVVIAPARSEWRKTTCQNRGCNESEVVCLIEVPRKYKTVTKKILLEPSVAKRVSIKPKYKTIQVQEVVEPATSKIVPIPAKYKTINIKKKIADAKFSWSNIEDENSRIRTQCDKICLTETPVKYKIVPKRVVIRPASIKKIKTPPKYITVKVKKIIKPASFKKAIIPAEYKIVRVERERTKGFAKWIPVVCESNITPTTVRKVQKALKEAGFYKGEINGVWDIESKLATRAYQKANGLAVTRLSIETMKSLGIY
ncbi:MAG: peptidoglycan-binding protein [Sulfurovaceae bacterium]|nr:peptidoglycan-binding protein [Sulfurovaceae bacterium]